MASTPDLIIVLSGHVSAGKTTLARGLGDTLKSVSLVSSRRILEDTLGSQNPTREALQLLGERLDTKTGGKWLRDAVLQSAASQSVVVVDAVRTPDQIDLLRSAAGRALHVHLQAPVSVLGHRYDQRRLAHPEVELPSYGQVLADPTEARVGHLASVADLVLNTALWSSEACTELVTTAISLLAADLVQSG